MLIAIPHSREDAAMLAELVDVLVSQGPLHGHSVVLFPTPSQMTEAFDAAAKLSALCECKVAGTGREFASGWPKAPNAHFAFVCHWIADAVASRQIEPGPFFWMEADCLPRAAGWADVLAAEYKRGAKPFMGRVIPTPFRDVKGNISTRTEVVNGKQWTDVMMQGCAIYPWNTVHRLAMFMRKLHDGDGGREEPWDVYCRHEIAIQGMAATELIADKWRTCNYRIEDGRLTCDSCVLPMVARSREGPVPESAVLVHGCKDGSLSRIILGGNIAAAPRNEPPKETKDCDKWWGTLALETRQGIMEKWEADKYAAILATPIPEVIDLEPADEEQDEDCREEELPAPKMVARGRKRKNASSILTIQEP